MKGPEGIVLAADSRVTLEAKNTSNPSAPPLMVNFDNASKLLSFSAPHDYVGAVTYGAAVIGLRTAHSFLPEFEQQLPKERLSVKAFAQQLSDFFQEQWKAVKNPPGSSMSFIVGGFDADAAYGSVFVFELPGSPTPSQRNADEDNFGMTWGGQVEFATRLIHGYDPSIAKPLAGRFSKSEKDVASFLESLVPQLQAKIPYMVLPLQDCIDLATFLIRTTMTAQALSIGVRGVGGPIEVAYIRRVQPLTFVQRKALRGETWTTSL